MDRIDRVKKAVIPLVAAIDHRPWCNTKTTYTHGCTCDIPDMVREAVDSISDLEKHREEIR